MIANEPKQIILLGYMGSGKSTVGKELAVLLEREFIDLDDYLEEREKASISQVIQEKGAIYFRKREHDCLKEVLEGDEKIVLALGGGTPCYYNNMKLISQSNEAISFYLRAAVPFLTNRLFDERAHRPLISRFEQQDDLAEFIGKHLLERSGFYNEATHNLSIENKTVNQIVAEIEDLL
ncbi:shikimate kinase [Nonlabens ponticola]|uniref:Shikimate kinase n=1 Tax=Nonlabens ponticola TaxID=2496866 RepID=A0A3S9N0H2_9FLAO|nr:shikimate kinase [Nonlabens ponticola]AZQ44889.1 shikimate kinase [Nonlabens ponticola]